MTDKPQVKIVFNEDEEIIMQIDAMAEEEGTNRSALIRRALRQMLRRIKQEVAEPA